MCWPIGLDVHDVTSVDLSLAKSELREEHMVASAPSSELPLFALGLSCDLVPTFPFLLSRMLQPRRQDGLTGGTGLNMNYSIIFTEINYPETSILLQIIQIIHMTYQ